MAITNSTLDSSGVDMYVSSGATALVIAYICNTGSTDATIQLHVVPSGDTAGTQNKIYNDLILPAGDTFIIDNEKIIFDTGDKLVGYSSVANDVVTTVSYVGI